MSFYRMILVGLICVFVLLAAPSGALARDALVGTWKIKVTPAEGNTEKEADDKITFKGGKFVSEKWQKEHKFEPTAYEEDTASGFVAKFTAKPASKTAGKMQWTGTSTANQIKGEITWTKPDGKELKYVFEGEKQ